MGSSRDRGLPTALERSNARSSISMARGPFARWTKLRARGTIMNHHHAMNEERPTATAIPLEIQASDSDSVTPGSFFLPPREKRRTA